MSNYQASFKLRIMELYFLKNNSSGSFSKTVTVINLLMLNIKQKTTQTTGQYQKYIVLYTTKV